MVSSAMKHIFRTECFVLAGHRADWRSAVIILVSDVNFHTSDLAAACHTVMPGHPAK